jgi:hypothetical protein
MPNPPVPCALQLATDDSFQFNRTVGVIKQHVKGLPEATADDDAVMSALQVGVADRDSRPGGILSESPCVLAVHARSRLDTVQAVLPAIYADAHHWHAGKVTWRPRWSRALAGSGTNTRCS